MGVVHLDVSVERMKSRFGVEVDMKPPKVPYRETIRGSTKVQGRHKKQSGGRGQFGVAEIEISPRERGAGSEFIDKTKGGSIPKEYIPAVKAGVKQALETGILAGYPVIDTLVTLLDGSYHPVDSSELAFRNAGILAVREVLGRAGPVLLEPIMSLEISAPDESFGDVLGDINSRRGQVNGVEPRGKLQIIKAQLPLAESFGYTTDLRSLSQGRATFSMEFDHYAQVPKEVTEKVTVGRVTAAKV